jgi:hypothetical protein
MRQRAAAELQGEPVSGTGATRGTTRRDRRRGTDIVAGAIDVTRNAAKHRSRNVTAGPRDMRNWFLEPDRARQGLLEKGTTHMKRLKGNTIHTLIWLTGILALVIASGAPNKIT